MSELLRLDPALRRRLVERFAERPWPPPARSDDDELFTRSARRILEDLADDPPEGFPDCADWLLIVPEESAAAVRSEAIDGRLLVAGSEQWAGLERSLRDELSTAGALLELRIAGRSPDEWAGRLPGAAPGGAEIAAALGEDAPAVLARLEAPGFGELELLHAWTRGPDGLRHAPDLSGVLALNAREG